MVELYLIASFLLGDGDIWFKFLWLNVALWSKFVFFWTMFSLAFSIIFGFSNDVIICFGFFYNLFLFFDYIDFIFFLTILTDDLSESSPILIVFLSSSSFRPSSPLSFIFRYFYCEFYSCSYIFSCFWEMYSELIIRFFWKFLCEIYSDLLFTFEWSLLMRDSYTSFMLSLLYLNCWRLSFVVSLLFLNLLRSFNLIFLFWIWAYLLFSSVSLKWCILLAILVMN